MINLFEKETLSQSCANGVTKVKQTELAKLNFQLIDTCIRVHAISGACGSPKMFLLCVIALNKRYKAAFNYNYLRWLFIHQSSGNLHEKHLVLFLQKNPCWIYNVLIETINEDMYIAPTKNGSETYLSIFLEFLSSTITESKILGYGSSQYLSCLIVFK